MTQPHCNVKTACGVGLTDQAHVPHGDSTTNICGKFSGYLEGSSTGTTDGLSAGNVRAITNDESFEGTQHGTHTHTLRRYICDSSNGLVTCGRSCRWTENNHTCEPQAPWMLTCNADMEVHKPAVPRKKNAFALGRTEDENTRSGIRKLGKPIFPNNFFHAIFLLSTTEVSGTLCD